MFLSPTKNISNPTKKILLTFLLLFLFKFGNSIPLSSIDNEALRKSFLQFETNNSIMQVLSMYTGGGGKTLLSPFSLGIIPFISVVLSQIEIFKVNYKVFCISLLKYFVFFIRCEPV